MAIVQFPENQVIKPLDSNEEITLGHITPNENIELTSIRPFLYSQGNVIGNMQLIIYQTTNYNIPYASSNILKVSDWQDGTNFLGFCRFDFGREILISGHKYYLTLKTSGYTKTSSVFLSILKDHYLNTINNIGTGATANYNVEFPYAFQLYGGVNA